MLLWFRWRRRRVLLGIRSGRSAAGGLSAGRSCTTGIKVFRQGMWPETELHQGFCLRKTRLGEPMIGLVPSHRVARLIVPPAIWFFIQITCLNQCLLDFLNTFRLRTQLCPPALRRDGSLALGRNTLCRCVAARAGVGSCALWLYA